MALSLPQAELLGSFLELILYGAYLVIFLRCLAVLHKKYIRGQSVKYLLCTAVTLFALVTLHLVMDIVRPMAAFTGDIDPLAFYSNVGSRLDVTKISVYVTMTLVSDGLILYRTFAVWNFRYLVAFVPFLLFLTDIGTSAWYIVSVHEAKAGDNALRAVVTFRSTLFFAFTLVLNVVCSLLISWKIWTIQCRVSGFVASSLSLTNVITVILESAAIYSLWLIVIMIINTNDSLFVMLNCISPVIGLVFSAIIIRVSTNTTDTKQTSKIGPLNFARPSGRSASSFPLSTVNSGTADRSVTLPRTTGGGVQIDLETIVHMDKRNTYDGSDGLENGSSCFDHPKGDSLV